MTPKFRIEVTDVTKTYASQSGCAPVHALDHVSFTVEHGERVGVIGANGAGKSSLLQLISGITEPTSGSISTTGKVHAILTVGVGLREHATGRENLYIDAAVQGWAKADVDKHIERMIEFAELGEFIDQPMRTYSSGMKARLAFTSLIMVEPEILLIDEALAVGDAFFVEKAIGVTQALAQRGGIVLYVSHSSEFIRQSCKRCIWLDHGKIRADGPSAEVTAAYQEEVRSREEIEISQKFGRDGMSWSVDPSFALSHAQLKVSGCTEASALIESGASVELLVHCKVPPSIDAKMSIWIERSDGLLVLREDVACDFRRPEFDLAIKLGRLDWRPFLYQAHIEVHAVSRIMAHAGTTFKIWSDDIITGGAPLLRQSFALDVRRL